MVGAVHFEEALSCSEGCTQESAYEEEGKFGLEVPGPGPGGVKSAFEVDAESGTNHFGVAMEKEVKTVLPALRILELGEAVPPGYTRIDLMTVFDVKMDLMRKPRIYARGDQADPPCFCHLCECFDS